jgi:hypothetical protein
MPQQQPPPRAQFRPRPWLFFIPIVCKNADHNNNNKRKKIAPFDSLTTSSFS